MESGSISCGDSRTWRAVPGSNWVESPQTRRFAQRYKGAPLVTLSVSEVDQAAHENLWYKVKLTHVDEEGFAMRCMSVASSKGYRVWHFTVSWTSLCR